VVLKALGALADLVAVDLLGVVPEYVLVGQCRAAAAERVLEIA
jgi:hypothetical protein